MNFNKFIFNFNFSSIYHASEVGFESFFRVCGNVDRGIIFGVKAMFALEFEIKSTITFNSFLK